MFLDAERGCHDLHPIVRGYAYDRLADREGVHTQLRDYFAAVPTPEQVESVEDLAPVIELYHHTVRAGRYDEARELYRDRLSDPLYFRLGAYQTEIELLRALFPDGEDRPPRLKEKSAQAWTLNALGGSYSLSGQPRRTVPLSEIQNALYEKLGSKGNLAIGLGNLASRQVYLGELAAAEGNLRRSIELGREIEDEFQEAIGHQELGRLLAYQGAFDEAARELDTALESFGKQGEIQSECVVWAYRALRALLMGEPEAALEAAHRARELADEVAKTSYPHEGDFVRAEWLLGAALVALSQEDTRYLQQAEPHLTQALTRCRRINLVELEPDILLAWARWHHASGNPDEARQDAEEALAITDRCEYRLKQAESHNFLARLAWERVDALRGTGNEDEATRALAEAREHAEIAKDRAWCDGPPHCYKPALEEAEGLLGEMGSQ
jgi:tetratricopeptide (TPR) repeat protein